VPLANLARDVVKEARLVIEALAFFLWWWNRLEDIVVSALFYFGLFLGKFGVG
jgi:hypothetical protein